MTFMSFSIRKAVDDDARFLPAIERSAGQAFRSVPELAWVADDGVMSVDAHRACIATRTCWVAVDEQGRVVGFLSAQRCGQDLHILEMSVAHDRQGRGLGRRLLSAAYDDARASGLSGLTLTTFRTIAWNAPFYEKSGFYMLPSDMPDARLAAVLREEAQAGFPPGSRCAMRCDVVD
ncbi:GNAT family N-acetyltransferase [Komagataeibacter europaeus]|uniref:GNAT family N-acetyltransferase n=1 Tax=Komagataeibacter europaeus TaxID=33995 RepID=UPI000366DAD7|nr:GNAT family N-acetyltransferase [Komagataeibacter europaeus]GBQ40696.1 acetyltransferase [Komagataeibacter europaeus LMG 18890]